MPRPRPHRPRAALPLLAALGLCAALAVPAAAETLRTPAAVAAALGKAPVAVSDDAGVTIDAAAVRTAVGTDPYRVAVVSAAAQVNGLQQVSDDVAIDLGSGGNEVVVIQSGTDAIAAAAQSEAPFRAGEATAIAAQAFAAASGSPTARLVAAVTALKVRAAANRAAHVVTTGDVAKIPAKAGHKGGHGVLWLLLFVLVVAVPVTAIGLLDRRRRRSKAVTAEQE